MIPRNLSSGSRFLIVALLCFCIGAANAQKKPPKNSIETFLDTQFWLGIKLGVNFTQAFPETEFSGFSPIDYDADSVRKTYDDFSMPGAHMGLEVKFAHKRFSLSLQPVFKRSRYSYQSSLEWNGEQANSRFLTEYDVEQRLDLIEVPLVFKVDILDAGKIRPFAGVGGFYSFVTSAQKIIDVTQTDFSSGSALTFSGGKTTIGVRDSFQNFAGVTGTVGVNLDYWNIRTVFEVNYKHSLTSVTEPNSQQIELASLGDVNDEINLRDINIAISFVFPLRFIDQQFKAY